ncbi:hypothetical protein E3N88_09905 [Mikania micrantha]|uniref:FHA domain-containing protein n=1 Tax=Mikania micrantha TaxID=192012 RepID=A0A5N6PAX4_9ASTR|nr:hypothetical protein E3N88_09905 [Mikania micrantha]
MEIESKNGSKIRLQDTIDFGRGGLVFDSTDRTVSRHHVSLKLHEDGTRVCFEVKGKNPIWVRDCRNDDVRVYKSSDRGELKTGDSFCVSSRNPVWYDLKRITFEEEINDDESNSKIRYHEALADISGVDHDEIDTGDISDIDPVKEFSFVVMGHEFDCYTMKLISDIRNWNWFLEEPNEDSDEEDEKKVVRKKRKKGGKGDGDDDDDDVWTGESKEDAELIKKSRNGPKPKYSTRSKDKHKKGAGAIKVAKDNSNRKARRDDHEDEDEDDDEEDETLGGFIVDDEDIGDEDDNDDDEEEEFEDDEDE